MPVKGKVAIQSAFEVENSCAFQHRVDVSDSPMAQMRFLGMVFSAKLRELFDMRNTMVILTVFLGKCVVIMPFLDKPYSFYSEIISLELSKG